MTVLTYPDYGQTLKIADTNYYYKLLLAIFILDFLIEHFAQLLRSKFFLEAHYLDSILTCCHI